MAENRFTEPTLDVDDIQGDPLVGFNKQFMSLVALNIRDGSSETVSDVRRWLRECVVPKVTAARDVLEFRQVFRSMRERNKGTKPKTIMQVCMNVSFSYDALDLLAPNSDLDQFYDINGKAVAFKIGQTYRSTLLGDPRTGTGAVKNWKVGSKQNPHIFLQIASERASLILEEIEELTEGFKKLNKCVEIEYNEMGKRRTDLPGREMFGFMDGISNPGVRGLYQPLKGDDTDLRYITRRHIAQDDPRCDMEGRPGENLLWPGEILLGLPKQASDTTNPAEALGPGSVKFQGPSWARNGTFLVFRRLKQDVASFWNTMHEWGKEVEKASGKSGFSDVHMGAKVVSRWPSGAPLIRSPDVDLVELGDDVMARNAYLFETDTEPYRLLPDGHTDPYPLGVRDAQGIACPLSGHNRKIQPRDANTDIGSDLDTLKHRILRRGIIYGDPPVDVYTDDGQDRGLLFVCYQASIDHQFEFLITQWANDTQNPNNGGGFDIIIGQSNREDRERWFEVPLEGKPTVRLTTKKDFVIPTGGGYFFVPSISALKEVITVE